MRDPLVVGVPGRIRIKAMDDRGDKREPELCHGGCVRKVFGVVLHKNVLLKWFSTIMQEGWEGSHTHVVWLWKNSSGAEDLLAVRRRIFMGLKEGLRKAADKGGGEIRIGRLGEKGFQEGEAVTGVGDDEIREDGMGMATGTDEAHDAEAVADWDAAHEVGQGAVIIGMDCTGAFRPAAGTGLKFGTEVVHKGIKQGF